MHSTSFTSLLSILVILASSCSARIIGISAPDSVKPGNWLQVTVASQDYIANWADYFVVFGLVPANDAVLCDSCIGSIIGQADLQAKGVSDSPVDYIQKVQIPVTTAPGTYVLTAAPTFGTGAAEDIEVRTFNTTVIVT